MLRHAGAAGDGSHTQQHRQNDIRQGPGPGARTGEVKGLEAEGGEGGKAAADSDHTKEANVFGEGISAVGRGGGAEVADDERADHVDKDGADGEANTSVEGNCEL